MTLCFTPLVALYLQCLHALLAETLGERRAELLRGDALAGKRLLAPVLDVAGAAQQLYFFFGGVSD